MRERIRHLLTLGVSVQFIARRLGVSKTTIRRLAPQELLPPPTRPRQLRPRIRRPRPRQREQRSPAELVQLVLFLFSRGDSPEEISERLAVSVNFAAQIIDVYQSRDHGQVSYLHFKGPAHSSHSWKKAWS